MAPRMCTTSFEPRLVLGLVGLLTLLSAPGDAAAATKNGRGRDHSASKPSSSSDKPAAKPAPSPQSGGAPQPAGQGNAPQAGPSQGGPSAPATGAQGGPTPGQGRNGDPAGATGRTGVQGQPGQQQGPTRAGQGMERPNTNMGGVGQGNSAGGSNARTAPDRGASADHSGATASTDSRARTAPDRGQSSGHTSASSGGDRGQSHHTSPSGTTRSYSSGANHHQRPAYQTQDHRYAHPSPHHHVQAYPDARHGPPPRAYYRASYVNWWVHPYYRYQHTATVVVSFGFVVNPWVVSWAPPPRAGWSWVGGYYDGWGVYHPGYWAPMAPPAAYVSAGYVYVPGWWQNNVYVEGYYRAPARHGWAWEDGYYLSDGSYVPGHWQPQTAAPAGYIWEPGFFDGDTWVEGFYRPEHRSNYTWVNGYFDEDGVFNAGYWMPTTAKPGYVWVPGWFDGQAWVEGYWEAESTYYSADVDNWQPQQGWNDGWQQSSSAPSEASAGSGKKATVAAQQPAEADDEDMPLAVPVEVEEEAR